MFAQRHELLESIKALTPKWSFGAVHGGQEWGGGLAYVQGPEFGPQLHRMK